MQPACGPVERSIAPSTDVPTRNLELGSGDSMGFTSNILTGAENVAPSSALAVKYDVPPELRPPRMTYTVPFASAKIALSPALPASAGTGTYTGGCALIAPAFTATRTGTDTPAGPAELIWF